VTEVSVRTGTGVVYRIVLNENGRKLAFEMADEKVEVTGTLKVEGKRKLLMVMSYKAVDEDLTEG